MPSSPARPLPEAANDMASGLDVFDLAPIPLWLEDFSATKRRLEQWRAEGLTDLRSFLREDLSRVAQCSGSIDILAVNSQVLALFEAESLEQLKSNLGLIFAGEMLETHLEELVQLWEGDLGFAGMAVNHTIGGRRLDIQIRARVLPGHEQDWSRVLVSTEDVTEREEARRRAARSDAYSKWLFAHSPVSLWVEDFSAVKRLMDDLRERGVSDFRTFTDVHPDFVARCMSEIRVLDVNIHTLELFEAASKDELLARLGDVFRDSMQEHFREQLVDLWNGKFFQSREVVNYALGGEALHVHMQFTVLPGHEEDWALVQVALTDITARKKAEAYLEYLGRHDVLTKLYNRSFHVEELNRLERKGPRPVTVVIADLNGLKDINDTLGHGAGDELLRRAGEVLGEAVEKPCHASRIGGDEFAVLMPASDESQGELLMERIGKLVDLNNQFYPGATLSFSLGAATSAPGERLEETVKRADLRMYEAKQAHYAQSGQGRRRVNGPSAS
ncbi:sensor domain-containing diguanylate cyclase [Aureimonas populi]|uniref:diguanylate cyclase n=1 Tax=Aureimonas populi TaxID=1701758 RepID=A0ABW5CN43_9HYPH|nr:sensor domain-containing diguanylate cyclase [Aureimonas populi]